MSLHQEYQKETGLNSCYYTRQGKHNKKGLLYTRKYVWWLELNIKELRESILNDSKDLEK